MTNKDKIKKISDYQKNINYHTLTCGNNSKHIPLIGKVIDHKVVLSCLDCSYIQHYIPDIIFNVK